MSAFEQNNNLNLAIESARSIGCNVTNITPSDFVDQNEQPVLNLLR